MPSAAPTADVLNAKALGLLNSSIRNNIIQTMNADCFTGAERKATGQRIKDTDDPEQLHRWLKNVRREREKRTNPPT